MHSRNKHCLTLRFAYAHSLADNLKGRLRCIRAHEQLRQKQRFLLKALAHEVERRNHVLIDNVQGLFALERLGSSLTRRPLQALDNRVIQAQLADNSRRSLRRICIMLHIFLTALVIACKRTEAIISIHHSLALRIDNAAGKSCRQRHREEGAVNSVAARQAEGNIRHAHNRVDATRLHRADNLAGNRRIIRARRNRQRQRVNNDVAAFNAILRRARDNLIGHSNTSCRRRRNALVVKAQRYKHSAVFFRQRQHMRKAVLLAVDGVQHRLAVIQAQGTLHCLVIGGINL